jgi:predicted amidophosphoribosyltransferase
VIGMSPSLSEKIPGGSKAFFIGQWQARITAFQNPSRCDDGPAEGALKVALREIFGPWDQGWVLDKHTLKSTYLGDDAQGHPQFDTVRSEAGEATFLLKYRSLWDRAPVLAQALAEHICPKFESVGFIVPMPASKSRARQPVSEVARALGQMKKTPVFENLLLKAPTGKLLKDLTTKEEKVSALSGTFSIHDEISSAGKWNVLLVDDLFDTGASMEEACKVLRNYAKVRSIYVAAFTWK